MIAETGTALPRRADSIAQAERVLLMGARGMLLVSAGLGDSAGPGGAGGSGPALIAHVHAVRSAGSPRQRSPSRRGWRRTATKPNLGQLQAGSPCTSAASRSEPLLGSSSRGRGISGGRGVDRYRSPASHPRLPGLASRSQPRDANTMGRATDQHGRRARRASGRYDPRAISARDTASGNATGAGWARHTRPSS